MSRGQVVVDASTVFALLADAGPDNAWARRQVEDRRLVAPTLLHYEVANALRRSLHGRKLDRTSAALAQEDLRSLAITMIGYEFLGDALWRHTGSLTAYDAAYVACAELMDAPLLTLDRRLQRGASGSVTVEYPPDD